MTEEQTENRFDLFYPILAPHPKGDSAQELAQEMYFPVIEADTPKSIVQSLFEIFAGGYKKIPSLAGVKNVPTEVIEKEVKQYFRLKEYTTVEARLAATGAGIINTVVNARRFDYERLKGGL